MSGSYIPLTAQQCVDIRRYMGYSLSGDTTSQPYREPVYSDVTLASLSLDYRLANLSNEEGCTVVTFFLANLYQRESDIQNAAANLDTDTAGPWKHNANEIQDRTNLFTKLRRDLCAFLGFAPGEGLGSVNRLVRA
ncbi:MAG: hypothetical protein WAL34_03985 [Acidobacteriaceae bacterium]